MQTRELPTGIITFLFTDLEKSTDLWEDYPQEMKSTLARHDAILKSAVESEAGFVVKTTGDGVHAAFPSAINGIKAVLASQLALISENWGATGPLRVRMALHSGEAELRDGDYYGSVVNRAARIMGAASGEQILVSQSTADLVNNQLPDDVSLLDLGQHHLRGLNRPEILYQLLHPDLPLDFPPLKTSSYVPNNLPVEMTSFIGRTRELADIKQLLAPSDSKERLITLTGPGGTGKTRLALQSAANALDHFSDGVWLIELAQITIPNQVAQAVATPIGLREQRERSLEMMITDHLRSQHALLILDNCEHLTDECARLTEILLKNCPKLYILSTSRETLGITGERAVRVRSLSLPPEDEDIPIGKLAQFEAIRLFIERAESVERGFTFDLRNAKDVSQICRRLDGIPLAIELAAARVRILSPGQIAERLDDRFRLLTGGSRTSLPRQQTLKALIDWSYELLPEKEQTLLCRLSVFSGGWILEAAENVAGFEPIESLEVLDLLEQLVNKSLVIVEDTEIGLGYFMLESIRQYAQEELTENGEKELLRKRHSSYYLEQSTKSFDALMNLYPPGDWGIKFKPEADNFRSAWAWAVEYDLTNALRFVSTFSLDWSQVVPLIEIHRFQEKVLALATSKQRLSDLEADEDDRRLFSRALISASIISFANRLVPLATEYAERSAALAGDLGDMPTFVWARSLLSTAASFSGGKEILLKWLEEDFDLVMQYGSDYNKATSLIRWPTFRFFASGQYDQESVAHWEEGMEMMRRSGNQWLQGNALQIAADLSKSRGDLEKAKSLANQVLEIFIDLGDIYAANPARSLLADIARQEGDFHQAADLYRETILVWRDTGRAESGVRTLESLAFTMHGISKDEQGEARQARLVYAIILISAADVVRQSNSSPVNFVDKADYERELAEIQAAVGESAFQSAWESGQSMDFDQVIIMAREYPNYA